MEQSTWSAAGVPRQIFLFIMLSLLVVSVYHFGGQFTETLEACPSVPTAVEEPAPTTEAPATQKPAASSQAPAPASQAPTAAPTEAPVVAASWLPASIPPCLHQVFSKYAYPPRKPTPAEFRVAGIDHIYVIHWTPLTQRLKTMTARFSRVLKAGWEEQNYVTFVNQYDARTIPDRDLVCLAGPKHYRLANGTLSVTTKHHFAYYDALVNNYSVIMLLEDDADFTSDFESEMTKITSALAKVPNWGNCMVSGGRFSGHGTEPYIDPAPSGEGSRFAYGYLVSTLGATQLLGNIPIRHNPDFQMNFAARETDFKSYFSRANPVFEVPDDKDGSWVSSKRK